MLGKIYDTRMKLNLESGQNRPFLAIALSEQYPDSFSGSTQWYSVVYLRHTFVVQYTSHCNVGCHYNCKPTSAQRKRTDFEPGTTLV